jgi:predicted DNA-binding transcriptional regulator AlpA
MAVDAESGPRWLDLASTARYLSVRPDALQRLVKAGRIPKPSYTLGPRSPRWDRSALDAAFDGASGSTDPDAASQAGVQQILAKGRTRRSVSAQRRLAPR